MAKQSAAIVTIKRAGEISLTGRRRIVAWLRKQAHFLEHHSKELSTRYTARYLYQTKGA